MVHITVTSLNNQRDVSSLQSSSSILTSRSVLFLPPPPFCGAAPSLTGSLPPLCHAKLHCSLSAPPYQNISSSISRTGPWGLRSPQSKEILTFMFWPIRNHKQQWPHLAIIAVYWGVPDHIPLLCYTSSNLSQ